MMDTLTLVITTADGETQSFACDSVNLISCDDSMGDNGGSIGIRRGHMPAVIALEPDSMIKAMQNGNRVYSAKIGGGFASVRNNTVTVVCSLLL